MPTIISHIKQMGEGSGHWAVQSNEEHCAGVARRAEEFAGAFGMATWGRALGMLHDKGKEKREFQEYIQDVNGIEGHRNYTQAGKQHAIVGALNAMQLYGSTAFNLFANPVAGHHAGLYDYCELEMKLQGDFPADVTPITEKFPINKPPFVPQATDFHHLTRMLYSCLVDADFLDTEAFMDPEAAALRGGKKRLEELYPLLEDFLAKIKQTAAASEVNTIRDQVQQCCYDTAKGEKGFYSLTVPTGGGKTLSSLLWAMRHAIHNGQRRIIIAIPYTSIIVQTAATLKHIFGEENVLEHHSNVDPEQIKDEQLRQRMRMAYENWDYPIIVTTNVQLFESMFANKPSECRKLHNICNSVLILDEVQTLPADFLQPIVDALKCYQRIFGMSVLLTTASQPVLSGLIEGCNPQAKFQGIEHITEIIPAAYRLHDRLRRVELQIDSEASSYDEIAARLAQHPLVLCIVNTRRDAKEIYDRLPKEGITLHLSRMMCPAHVSSTIEEVKSALRDKGNTTIRVIATQLIEAGVDIDFPVVYRQETGLDSVLQAAGRCNREGKLDRCTTHVFSFAKERALPRGSMTFANNARLALSGDSDWFAPDTMTDYFRQLYCRTQSFDRKDIKHYLYNPSEICFETAAEEFNLIEDDTTAVIVNWHNSLDLVAQLQAEGPSYRLMRQLSKYSVSLRRRDFLTLRDSGAVTEEMEGIYVVSSRGQYDAHVGLITDNQWLEEIAII